MKKKNAFSKLPIYELQIGKNPVRQDSMRLSGRLILVAFVCFLVIAGLAILHGQKQAPYHVQGLRWQSLRRVCRVSITVKNPRDRSIKARALIQAFAKVIPPGSDYPSFYVLTGSAELPITLAANQSKRFVKDVVFSDTPRECDAVEIQRLGGTGGHKEVTHS